MQKQDWQGVFPAITTPFNQDLSIDHTFLGEHAGWMIDSGCRGIVALGSLGEAATLQFEEKVQILKTLKQSLGSRAAVIAGSPG
jgi:4-hydroxy-tetrahydrodipicolinate synthase